MSSASTVCLPALHISTCYTWALTRDNHPLFLLFEIPSQFILVFASFVHIPRWPSILQFSFIGCVPPYPERKNSCLKSGSHCPSLSCLPFQRTGHRKLKREREQAKSISFSVSPHKKINIEEPLSDIFLQIKSVSVFTVKKKTAMVSLLLSHFPDLWLFELCNTACYFYRNLRHPWGCFMVTVNAGWILEPNLHITQKGFQPCEIAA